MVEVIKKYGNRKLKTKEFSTDTLYKKYDFVENKKSVNEVLIDELKIRNLYGFKITDYKTNKAVYQNIIEMCKRFPIDKFGSFNFYIENLGNGEIKISLGGYMGAIKGALWDYEEYLAKLEKGDVETIEFNFKDAVK